MGTYTVVQTIAGNYAVILKDINIHIHAWTDTHTQLCEAANISLHCPLVSGNWLPKVFSIFTNKDSQTGQ